MEEVSGYQNFMDGVFAVMEKFPAYTYEGIMEMPATRYLAMLDYMKRQAAMLEEKFRRR
jgi:hypothetical protein